MRYLVLFLFSLGLLSAGNPHNPGNAGYRDKDMDGVSDRFDRCPNTPFFALVNRNGCMIKRLKVSGRSHQMAIRFLQKRR